MGDLHDSLFKLPEPKAKRSKKSAGPLEREIQKRILLALEGRPELGRFTRNNVGQLEDRRGVPLVYGLGSGSPDIVGAVKPWGRFIGLEVKRPGEKPSEKQQRWAARWREVGIFYAVVHSVEEALAAVEQARGGGGR